MKVSDIMEKHVEFAAPDAKILDVARIIFGRHISGLPICSGKKIIGFVSEADILSKFHPTMKEFAEDPFSSSNFEKMEEKTDEIFNLTARDIMSKKILTVYEDDPLLRADSTMRIENVGRLSVIDKKGNLVGIITKGDIFKSLVGRKMPYLDSEEYHDWIARHFDMAIGWDTRTPSEINPLVGLYHKKGVKKIIDVGCGTGEHAIALAKNGFHVVGVDNSRVMIRIAEKKCKELPKEIKSRLTFIQGDYIKKLKQIKGEYQAAMFMGNAMAHMPNTYKEILEVLDSVLSKKKSLVVSQLINFDKMLKYHKGLYRFVVQQSGMSPLWKHGYLWFFDAPQEKGGLLTLNAEILDFNGERWNFRGMNSVQTVPFTKNGLKNIFEKNNFPKINFYGSKGSESIFSHKFNIAKNDYLTVVAER